MQGTEASYIPTSADLDLLQTCDVVCSIRKKIAAQEGKQLGLSGVFPAATADAPCKPGLSSIRSEHTTDVLLTSSTAHGCSNEETAPGAGQTCSTAAFVSQAAATSSSTQSSPSSRCCGIPAVECLALGRSTSDPQVNTAEMPLPQPCPALAPLIPSSTASSTRPETVPLDAAQGAADAPMQPPLEDAAASVNPIVLGSSLFFARVPPTVSYESILELFVQFGEVQTLNLFRPWATAKTSKGCGIVVYKHIASALAAMEALHNKYHWTGGETTMVVEWADPSRHRRENPNTKGVFEAKHKALAMAGSKSRYRAQMRRAVAFGLQQACAAAGAPHHMLTNLPEPRAPVAAGSRAPAMAHRGVAAMLPQLAGPGLSAASAEPWGALAGHGAAAQSAYASAVAAAAAASHANGLTLSAAWLDMAGGSPAGGVMTPDARQVAYCQDAGLSTTCNAPAAMPLSSSFVPGSWGTLPHA